VTRARQHAGQGSLFDERRPTGHGSHRMHENSQRSWRELDFTGRKLDLCRALAELGVASTDRQLCQHLRRQDMNYVRPAITRLVRDRIFAEVGSVTDGLTNRRVRKVWFAAERAEGSEGGAA